MTFDVNFCIAFLVGWIMGMYGGVAWFENIVSVSRLKDIAKWVNSWDK